MGFSAEDNQFLGGMVDNLTIILQDIDELPAPDDIVPAALEEIALRFKSETARMSRDIERHVLASGPVDPDRVVMMMATVLGHATAKYLAHKYMPANGRDETFIEMTARRRSQAEFNHKFEMVADRSRELPDPVEQVDVSDALDQAFKGRAR